MDEVLELARAKDTKERMAGVERLHQLLEASRKSLCIAEAMSLVDCCLDLLKDSNFKVSQGALQCLASAAVLSGDHLKLHLNALVPPVVERLGDAKQPVRDAARRLLLTLMEVSSPTIVVERAGTFAWTHKSWRVREEFARTVTSAIGLFASTELPLQRAILPPISQMLNDPNPGVREAALVCIEEMYAQFGTQFRDELHRHNIPTYMIKDINARLEKIEPQVRTSEGVMRNFAIVETRPTSFNPKKSSPKAKSSSKEMSLFRAANDLIEKPIEPIKVYSEKELIREFDKIASTLVPEKDWSIRILAMQRVEGLVLGGATDYPSFGGLLKQLVVPLSTQLSDRRSSIVKQACHLLCFLSKELLGDFEACAEMFIPVLFKLVVITVLVIAESADNCIKTMLRNCKVSRVLPRIADCAKNDRSAVLRARCCEYALLILEHWPDAPEIQRLGDLYEDLIRCCVADAMSEVRSIARMCYRMFAKTWPERSRRLFLFFDPVIQRLINEEDGTLHRRHASPSPRDSCSQVLFASQASVPSNFPGYGTSALVAMDRTSSLFSGHSLSSGLLLSQAKSLGKGRERSLESVLHSSKQKVTAIESMLRGFEVSDKQNPSSLQSSSLDLGVDPPSSRDPPYPAAVPASKHLMNSLAAESMVSNISNGGNHNGGLVLSDIITQIQASKDFAKLSYHSTAAAESALALSSFSAKRLPQRGSVEENNDAREARRYQNSNFDSQYSDAPYKDANFGDSHSSHIPNFQKPLLRKHVTGRMSAGRRRSFDDSQLSLEKLSNYVEGPASLIDSLSDGFNPSSDWIARVAAFNYLRSLLQQGAKGIQEVLQNFEKVMKLFFEHLDDPHHKVAQAALSTLADIIPSCRKPFESYMERILPHVFSRLIDPKELVRQPCSTTLEIISKTYGVDTLLPSLLRSLDEQRSPKAKLAVIEFAINSFNKHAMNSDGAGNAGILKLWLAKLMPLAHDKNTKLKEAAITCIISIYSHFDSGAVLHCVLSLSVEEQNSLRRALKQYTPRIEVDLMNYLQNKKERSKSLYDPSDVVGTSSDEGYMGLSKKSHLFGKYSTSSIDSDGGRKWISNQESTPITGVNHPAASDETHENLYENFETGTRDMTYIATSTGQNIGTRPNQVEKVEKSLNFDSLSTPYVGINGLVKSEAIAVSETFVHDTDTACILDLDHQKPAAEKIDPSTETGSSIHQMIHLICKESNGTPGTRCSALQQLIGASMANDHSVWSKYFNQILTAVLEVLDDSDSSIRELALSLVIEMLKSQKDAMEDSVEIVVEKLLQVTKDIIPKVASEAEHCLTVMLSQYDPFRCLSVVVPLLVTEDEKTLIDCINCLTKLVGRLSQEELMVQLPSFLPALFEAFGNRSADVRKVIRPIDLYIGFSL
ncbi:hypothetical protein K2173_012773 [Erythroxylum novogranatense]|uniref:TOG domain-containing protein n=1 Tax=Erythroxylum novogranatense TaxID=1862640 RepID=A0AAV8U9T7_9ROSI|nr:hypothetical protein K2173_012773 [Erythroxylum novogranatense]